MMRLLKAVAALLMASVTFIPTAVGQAATQESAIRKVLESQVEAWNRHDLESFMAGYWNSPDLTFFSSATETQGWQATLDRYRKKYQSADTEMGKLEFRDLQVEMLGPKAGFVRGRFLLTLSSGKQPHGLFTLIVHEFPEGWRIVHDHSSGE